MAVVGWCFCFDGHGVKVMGFHSTASATAALIARRGHIALETFSNWETCSGRKGLTAQFEVIRF